MMDIDTYLSCEVSTFVSSAEEAPLEAFFPFDDDDDDDLLLEPTTLGAGLVCIRKLAVKTNCPTAAEKPLRKALKG